MGKTIESACEYGIQLATDDSHGYDQINRWLPDVDCSSLVCLCYEQAGVPVKTKGGATYTGNLKAGFTKCGFTAIPFKKPATGLKRGDVLFYHHVENGKTRGHAILYLGNGKIVQASINEKGTATGGRTGDQTKKEVEIGNYYVPSCGWDWVLRYQEAEVITVTIDIRELHQGDICPEVGLLQTLLNSLGYVGKNGKRLTVDNYFKEGGNTAYALANYQKAKGLTPDIICGRKTWTCLLQEHYD